MNTSKTLLVSTTVVIALALVLAPLAAADDAFAGKKSKKSNFAQQIISQVQKSSQNSQVVSGGDSVGSGNNFNFQFQSNSGSNALAQSND